MLSVVCVRLKLVATVSLFSLHCLLLLQRIMGCIIKRLYLLLLINSNKL
jgi:hypothetical protein